MGTTQPTAGLQKDLKIHALPQKWPSGGVTFHFKFSQIDVYSLNFVSRFHSVVQTTKQWVVQIIQLWLIPASKDYPKGTFINDCKQVCVSYCPKK